MKKYLLFFALVILSFSGCMNHSKSEKQGTTIDSVTTAKPAKVAVVSDGCVFDTASYKFTTDALLKYRDDIKYTWNSKKGEAMTVLENGDTLLLQIGGCNHFSYSATLLSSIAFEDTKSLTDKSKWLAKTFFSAGFDKNYDALITEGKYEINEHYYPKSVKAYEMTPTDTTVTDMVYEGFTFESLGKRTKIHISGYVD